MPLHNLSQREEVEKLLASLLETQKLGGAVPLPGSNTLGGGQTSPDPLQVQQAVSSLGLNIPEAQPPLEVSQMTQFLNSQGPELRPQDFPDKGGFLDPGNPLEAQLPQQASAQAAPSGGPSKMNLFLTEILPLLISGGLGAAAGGVSGAGASLGGFAQTRQRQMDRDFQAGESTKRQDVAQALEEFRQEGADRRQGRTLDSQQLDREIRAINLCGPGCAIPEHLQPMFGGITKLQDDTEIKILTQTDIEADGSEIQQQIPVFINKTNGSITRADQALVTSTAAAPPIEPVELTQAAKDDFAEIREVLDLGMQMDALFDESFVGQFQGRVGGLQQASGMFITPEESEFRTLNAKAFNITAKLRSGAVINKEELERLQGELPNLTDPDSVYPVKLRVFIESLRQILFEKGGAAQLPENIERAPQVPLNSSRQSTPTSGPRLPQSKTAEDFFRNNP